MQVKKMYQRVVTQIFTWAGEEPLVIGYDGNTFVIPPRFETAKLGPDSIYRAESARDGHGDLIPGTIVVADIVTTTPEGSRKIVLSVTDFCDYLTRDRDDLFARGFNIVGSWQEVKEAIESGIPLYELSQDVRARDILASELERQKRFEAKGQPAPPREDQHNVDWAVKHLKSRETSLKPATSADELRSVLEGRFLTKPAAAPVVAPAITKTVSSAQEVYDRALELGISLSKSELAGLLGRDEAQVAFVLEKIKAREAQGAEAPA